MKINTLTKKYAIGLAFACGMLMNSSLASANTINIVDGAVINGTLTSGAAPVVFLGYLPGETPYVAPGVTDLASAQLFTFHPSNPSNEEDFFDALAGVSVGAATQVLCVGVNPACQHNVAVSAATTYFSLKLGDSYAFFKNTTGFILALIYNQVDGVGGGLSHVTLYGNRLPFNNAPTVPLPAAFPLLLGALGGLTWLSRSRKRKLQA